MYTITQEKDFMVVSNGTKTVRIKTNAYHAITSISEPLITTKLVELLANKAALSRGEAVTLLEKVSNGYKSFCGIQLLVAVEVDGKRAFRTAKQGESLQKQTLPIITPNKRPMSIKESQPERANKPAIIIRKNSKQNEVMSSTS